MKDRQYNTSGSLLLAPTELKTFLHAESTLKSPWQFSLLLFGLDDLGLGAGFFIIPRAFAVARL